MKNIKEKMQSGDVQGAADGLKSLLAAEPENTEAQMLYGTCCRILGDDRTFGEIHDALAPKMAAETDERILERWRKYQLMFADLHADPLAHDMRWAEAGIVLMEALVLAGTIIAALCVAACIWWGKVRNNALYSGTAINTPTYSVDAHQEDAIPGTQESSSFRRETK